MVIICDSNGEAINRALEDNIETSVAVGPAFAVNPGQVILKKGIDNNTGSETSFALISNPKNPLILPESYNHDEKWGAISYAKVNQLGDSQLPLALELYGVERYANRSTNSPASGMPVIGKDMIADSPKQLYDLINGLNAGLPGIHIQVKMGGKFITLDESRGVLEHNYLGPCPVLNIH